MAEIPAERHDRREWHDRDVDETLPPALLKRVSWGAIFAGAVSAVALTALLGLLGLGIGFDSFEVGEDTLGGIPKSTAIWWAATSIIATGIGAFVAGRLAGIPHSLTGALHGLAVWAVASLFTLWLATTAAGAVLGAATSVASTTARVATGAVTTVGGVAIDAAGAAAPGQEQIGQARTRVEREASEILGEAGIGQSELQQAQQAAGETVSNIAMRPGTAGAEIDRLISDLFDGPDAVLSPQQREQLVTQLEQRSGISEQEARQIADRWQAQATAARQQTSQTVGQVETRAGEVSNDVIDVMADISWYMFWSSLAGLVAAMIGAALAGASLTGSGSTTRRVEGDHVHDDRV